MLASKLKVKGTLAGAAVLSALASTVSYADVLSTTFASNNARRGNMFDITVANALTIQSFDVNLASNLTKDIFIYYKTGTWVGFDTNASAWTLLGSASVTSAGNDIPTAVDTPDLALAAGNYALFVTTDGSTPGAILYTNGTTSFSDANLTIFSGGGTAVPFVDGAIDDRIWNGNIHYSLSAVPEPETYAMMLAGLGLLGFAARRRKQKTEVAAA
jgi:hypothetical protein